MPALHLSSRVTQKDALAFSFYHYYRKSSSLVVLMIVVFSIFYFLMSHEGWDLSLILIMATLLCLYLMIPVILFYKSRKAYLSEKKFQAPMAWTLDEEKAVVVGDGFETTFNWDRIHKVTENNSAFLIYQNANSVNLIPKRDMSAGEMAQFRILMINIPNLFTELRVNKSEPFGDIFLPATKLQRLLNALLDTLIFGILFGALTFLYIVMYVKMTKDTDPTPSLVTLMPYIVILPFFVLYFFLTEYFFQCSPAKWLTKTKVVTYDYSRPTAKQILGRSLARCIPFEFVSFLVSSEGVHDLISKTRVISSK